MTIDEAIAREKDIANKNYAQGMLCHANPNDDKLDSCIECAREHEQIAEWLEDYKFIKQWKSDAIDDMCRYDANSLEELIINARKKVINELISRMEYADNVRECIMLAEELKRGGVDELRKY